MTIRHPTLWLDSGAEAFASMLKAIEAARASVRLETYLFANDDVGRRFRDALIKACSRGVSVRVLVDSLGSFRLPANFWRPLIAVGGEARWFNPLLGPTRFEIRNHRKLLVCDDAVAFIGGFNLADQYEGDGVRSGWRDLGLRITNSLTRVLAASFDVMFEGAQLHHDEGRRGLRKSLQGRRRTFGEGELLLSGPGPGRNPFKRRLRQSLRRARDVKIIAAYFLPSWRIRRELAQVVRRGGTVQLILAGKSDVFFSQMACRRLYHRLLKSGVQIYEYQPQILHAKLIIIDDAVYVGSANLDPRSLQINYELMLRFQTPAVVASARQAFQKDLALSTRVEWKAWHRSGNWWKTLWQRCAYFILAQLDPLIARWLSGGFRPH